MKRLLIAAAILALAPAGAFAADMSGAWKIDGNFNDAIKYTVTCTLTQDGSKLAGPCVNAAGGAPIAASGSIDGAKMVISYDTTYNGGPIHLDYRGDVQPDGSLKGIIDAGMAQGTFVAAKQ